MDTKDIRKQIGDIYIMVSTLQASGDAVDTIAAVRARLRRLDGSIAELEKGADTDGGQDNG